MKTFFAATVPGVLIALTSAGAVQARAYPAKTVRVVCPWPASGLVDVAGRIVFQKISDNTGQQFIVDNRPDAIGVIGAEIVARAPADGGGIRHTRLRVSRLGGGDGPGEFTASDRRSHQCGNHQIHR